MVTNCPYAGINKRIKIYNTLKQWDLLRHNGNTSNGEVPFDIVNIDTLEMYENLKNIARSNLKLFYKE